jgi:hypothetical protein
VVFLSSSKETPRQYLKCQLATLLTSSYRPEEVRIGSFYNLVFFRFREITYGVYPKVSGLAAWSENCKWYNSLPLGAVVSLFL